MESEKADFSFEKIQEKHKKYGNEMKNFSVPLGKRQEKLFQRSEKGLKKRTIRMKKSSRLFFASGRKNAEKDARQDRKICRSIRKNMKISRRKENKCISGRMVHSEKIDFLSKEDEEKNRLMEKK